MGQSQQEDNQTCCRRGTQGISRTLQTKHTVALELITSRFTLWEELGSLELKTQLHQGPGSKATTASAKYISGLEKEFCSFSMQQASGKVLVDQSVKLSTNTQGRCSLVGAFLGH